MPLISRRDAGKLMLIGCAGGMLHGRLVSAAPKPNSVVRGVQIGAQAWSFRDRSLNACIVALTDVGLSECELSQAQFTRPNPPDPDPNPVHNDTPLSVYKDIRKK